MSETGNQQAGAMSDTCEHDWAYGEGRNAGGATCRRCRKSSSDWVIAFNLQKERDLARAALAAMTAERDEARKLFDDLDTLVWDFSGGFHDSTRWQEEYEAEWQAIWNRRTW